MLGTLFVILAAVVLLGGLLRRRQVRRTVEGEEPVVTDELLRTLLDEAGRDEEESNPLDEDEIRRAEDEFWRQEWDEPEEWGRS